MHLCEKMVSPGTQKQNAQHGSCDASAAIHLSNKYVQTTCQAVVSTTLLCSSTGVEIALLLYVPPIGSWRLCLPVRPADEGALFGSHRWLQVELSVNMSQRTEPRTRHLWVLLHATLFLKVGQRTWLTEGNLGQSAPPNRPTIWTCESQEPDDWPRRMIRAASLQALW